MIIKEIRDEDFINYKKPSMFITFPTCSFKCERESEVRCCQNSDLALAPNIEADVHTIVQRYLDNPITHAICCGGMEPFDSWDDLQALIMNFRYYSMDDIVIYTGYNREEISQEQIDWLKLYALDGPIIIKWGRFIPNQQKHYDAVLGVKLASNNQHAEVI